ncbi:hypothetical protein [Clostridium sp.]|jgi:hypothetical protein|uniref:hypothetical protein n=1 Tax=Clostridium sp. TaxID=1506 RepID=UPI003EEFD76B
MKFFTFIYNGFVLGLFFSILAFQSVWLEMRMNVGIIIFITIILSIIIYAVVLLKKKRVLEKSLKIVTLWSFGISAIVTLLILGTKRITTLPASIFREALGLTNIKFAIINIILLVILLGIVPILASKKE